MDHRGFQSYLNEALFQHHSQSSSSGKESSSEEDDEKKFFFVYPDQDAAAAMIQEKSASNFISYLNEAEDEEEEERAKSDDSKSGRINFLRRKFSFQYDSNFATARRRSKKEAGNNGGVNNGKTPTLTRSLSSREVSSSSPSKNWKLRRFRKSFDNIKEEGEENCITQESIPSSSSPGPSFVLGGKLKRTLTVGSVAVANWNKSFRQRLHERTQSFRNLDSRLKRFEIAI